MAPQVKIEKLIYGGEGLTHFNGETIFVPLVLPGEEVEIEIAERKKKLVRAQASRLLKSSPERIEPRCPHFGVCGGCDYQHASYDEQVHIKQAILRETLRRIGTIDWNGPIAIHKSPPWEYRNRAQWKVRSAGRGTTRNSPQPQNEIGYFRARSTALCPTEVCFIISPKLLETFRILRDAFANGALPSSIREIEAFTNNGDTELLLNISCSSLPRSPDQFLQQVSELVPAAKSILAQDSAGRQMALHGAGFIPYAVADRLFRVSHLSFFQVNRFLIEEVAATVTPLAGSGDLALDLYAGVGLFSAFLADNFRQVLAVEAHPVAARDLEINIAATLKNIELHNDASHDFLNEWRRKHHARTPDVVVADPPRAGLDNGVAEQLANLGSSRILYVSCDPATLARDLAKLCTNVYTLREIHLFDMFPQTYHIESVALLERAR